MGTSAQFFTKKLLDWHRHHNQREMPWKGEKDPYKIWISEIILQQTRVEQGLSYYNKFILQYPDVHLLACAKDDEVFKLWEGLGYYTRCKNLIATARFISKELNGKFPESYENILNLKGVGPYTSAAIASFAYNLPFAVLDGNVFRVLSRYFAIDTPINTPAGKKYYGELAQSLLAAKQPGEFNQAIMDLGATICKPASPLCSTCPLSKHCKAYLEDRVNELPINEKIVKQRKRFFNYLVISHRGKYYVHKRSGKDIWENLHEFYLIEDKTLLTIQSLENHPSFLAIGGEKMKLKKMTTVPSQKLTHQTIAANVFELSSTKSPVLPDTFFAADEDELATLAFPRLIANYLKEKKVSLNS